SLLLLLFGLDYIPGFKERVGHEFFLETIDLYIKYNESLFLGDTLTIDICVGNIESCSFDLFANFRKGDTLCATGIQKVAWCEYKTDEKYGKVLRPVKIPEDIATLFKSSALF
ncbi:MAG: thioesterase family protein, partial [Bacteroidota bacterium]